jgi:hypothetical protein
MLGKYNLYSLKQGSNVAQASSRWQQLVKRIKGSSLTQSNLSKRKQFQMHRFREPGGWLFGLTVVVAMLLCNWRLFLATGVGVFVLMLVYLMQEWDWQVNLSDLRRFLSGSNRQLTLAVGSGGVATLSTYIAVSIWIDSDSSWIAAGAILQGFGTLATLLLLVWQIINRQANRDEAKLNAMLADLTDVDPLKRLIAVRQLIQWGTDSQLERHTRRHLADYFCLMLNREQETVVRDAVLEGLQVFGNTPILNKGTAPLQIPVTLKRATVKVSRRHS